MRTSGLVAVVASMVIGLFACSSSEPTAEPTPTATVPKGFEVPDGVTLTTGGTTLAVGKPATVVHQLPDGAASAVTVTVSDVADGDIDDFRFFSLDDATKKSSPFYVTVSVRNDGPAGLGGTGLPIFAHDSTNVLVPASDIVGTFKPCRRSTLPSSFLPGATAELCLVYLVPEGRTLETIDLQTGSTQDAVRWKP